MEVLGISPIQRLVVPRVLATMLVAALLNGLVSVVGVAGGYVFNVLVQGGTPGAYLASFTALAQLADLVTSEIKALLFGALAALVASYKGLTAGGGPKGVGDAVNQAVVITFMLLFVVNFVISADLLPGRPPEDLMPMTRLASATRAPLRLLDELSAQMRFYVQSIRWVPRTLRRYTQGGRAAARRGLARHRGAERHRRHGRRADLPRVLHRLRGRPAGLSARSTSSAPAPSPASSRRTSTPARSPRSWPAWRSPPPSAAASPPSSGRCGSARRSTPSR